jgi:hypothetical protein
MKDKDLNLDDMETSMLICLIYSGGLFCYNRYNRERKGVYICGYRCNERLEDNTEGSKRFKCWVTRKTVRLKM